MTITTPWYHPVATGHRLHSIKINKGPNMKILFIA